MPTRHPARLRGSATDVVLAAVLLVAGQVEVWTGGHLGGVGAVPPDAPRTLLALSTAVATGALVGRRRRPLTTAAVVAATLAGQVLLVVPAASLLAGMLPLLLVTFSAAAYAVERWRPVGLVLGLGVLAALVVGVPEERAPGEVVFGAFVITGAWVLGQAVALRLQHADQVVAAADRRVGEQRRRLATIREEERARIARELHDVIAHGVSLMGVQAAAARVLVDRDPEAAARTLRGVEEQARESIAELQRLLGVLRGPADPEIDPQPGLADLPALVESMATAGVPVRVHSQGGARPLPGGADLAAFRVVQEALTNTLKHAGPVPVTVHLAWSADALRIEVCDTGGSRSVESVPSVPSVPSAQPEPSAEPAPSPGAVVPSCTGHGLVGMRERVALYGGDVVAGARPGGGFRVLARLPLPEPAG